MKKEELKTIIIIAIILGIVSFGVYAFRYIQIKNREAGITYVYVQRGNEVVAKYDIDVDGYYDIQGDYGTFHLQIEGGRYRAINVDCPNKNCEGFGWIEKGSLVTISCLPNGIYVYQ